MRGNALGRFNRAMMLLHHLRGEGESGDPIELLTSAAEKGLPEAQFALGRHYYEAGGTERNLPLARFWFSQALDAGYKDAKTWLQLMGSRWRGGRTPVRE